MDEILKLLWGTVQLRPYVFAFLAVYLAASGVHLGWGRTLLYIPLGYGIAWLSEFSSIHWGFPYGDYFYISTTMNRELWVFGVPFMDSLSYVFLSYCSYSMAIFLLSPLSGPRFPGILETRRLRRSWRVLVLGSFLFVLLDIITDPVALQGSRWFLGQIYGYRSPGYYFGDSHEQFRGMAVGGIGTGRNHPIARPAHGSLPIRPHLLPPAGAFQVSGSCALSFGVGFQPDHNLHDR